MLNYTISDIKIDPIITFFKGHMHRVIFIQLKNTYFYIYQ